MSEQDLLNRISRLELDAWALRASLGSTERDRDLAAEALAASREEARRATEERDRVRAVSADEATHAAAEMWKVADKLAAAEARAERLVGRFSALRAAAWDIRCARNLDGSLTLTRAKVAPLVEALDALDSALANDGKGET